MIVQAHVPDSQDEVQEAKKPWGKKFKAWRFAVWMRDDFRCVYCGQDLIRDFQTLHTATVDHLKPKSAGGGYEQENLVTCCSSCNCLKAGKEVDSIEEGREIIAHRRSMVMGHFIEQAREHGIQFPRNVDTPADKTLVAFETLNSLNAFVHAARRLSGEINQIGKRASKIEARLDTLDYVRELFEPSPEELASDCTAKTMPLP